MLSGLDCELLGGKSESIPTHRMKDVEAAHPLEARNNVGGGVAFHVPDVKALAAGIGKHVQHVVFGPGGVKAGVFRIGRSECALG